MSHLIYLGQGIIAYPYTVIKLVGGYMIPWLSPKLTLEHADQPSKEIELIGRPLFPDKNDDLVQSIISDDPEKSTHTAIIPYHPRLSIHTPTLGEISSRALTTVIIDIPFYTVKSMYTSPIPTIIALYAVLPAPVWQAMVPNILYYLPRLL
jgi:hypothetical protein